MLMMKRPRRERPTTPADFMRRYPRLVAHMICFSLGYATPQKAANICLDAINGRENWCEWIYSCYRRDPKPALAGAIRNRHNHSGYMSEYRQAIAIVRRELTTGQSPMFASWF
jgi:hypothetical protein